MLPRDYLFHRSIKPSSSCIHAVYTDVKCAVQYTVHVHVHRSGYQGNRGPPWPSVVQDFHHSSYYQQCVCVCVCVCVCACACVSVCE